MIASAWTKVLQAPGCWFPRGMPSVVQAFAAHGFMGQRNPAAGRSAQEHAFPIVRRLRRRRQRGPGKDELLAQRLKDKALRRCPATMRVLSYREFNLWSHRDGHRWPPPIACSALTSPDRDLAISS